MFWNKHKQHGPRNQRGAFGPHTACGTDGAREPHGQRDIDGQRGRDRERGPHAEFGRHGRRNPDRERGPHAEFGRRGQRGPERRSDQPDLQEQHGKPDHSKRGRHWFAPRGRGRPDWPFRHGGPGGGPGGGPDGGRPPFDEERGGRRRHRRGDMKFALLELLAEQPRHGYDLIKALEERYGGFYRPSPGSVYPTLQLLEDEGHLTSETVEGKRTYSITESGRGLLAERPARDEHGRGPDGRHRHMHEARPELEALRSNTEALIASITQVAQHGTAEQAQAVAALLDANRRAIYRILAGDRDSDPA